MQLCLGTAQLGLAYGINNATGMPSDESARAILAAAKRSGFTMLDTSVQYGVAQKRICQFMAGHPGAFTVAQRFTPGYISVYTPDEAWAATEAKWIQFPANILDGRCSAMIPRLQARGQVVFVRSLLLQGLLASDPKAGLKGNVGDGPPMFDVGLYVGMLGLMARIWDMNLVEVCIRWAWTIMPDVAVVGCETPEQVEQVAKYWKRGALPGDLVTAMIKSREDVPERLISPRMWGQRFAFTECK